MSNKNRFGERSSNYRHGMGKTRFYKIWKHINQRCSCKSNADFSYYGGRGINTSWKEFNQFRDEMLVSYLEHAQEFGETNTTIERIDNNKGYSSTNCKWATRAEQARNTRRTHLITFGGTTMCLVDWARKIGVKRATLSNRLNLYDWPIDKALTTVVR